MNDPQLLAFVFEKLDQWFSDPCGYVFSDCHPDRVLESAGWCEQHCDFNAKHGKCWRALFEQLYQKEHGQS